MRRTNSKLRSILDLHATSGLSAPRISDVKSHLSSFVALFFPFYPAYSSSFLLLLLLFLFQRTYLWSTRVHTSPPRSLACSCQPYIPHVSNSRRNFELRLHRWRVTHSFPSRSVEYTSMLQCSSPGSSFGGKSGCNRRRNIQLNYTFLTGIADNNLKSCS